MAGVRRGAIGWHARLLAVAVCIASVTLMSMCILSVEGLTVTVEPRSTFCVRETISGVHVTTFSFNVQGNQRSDLTVTLREDKPTTSRVPGTVLNTWFSASADQFAIEPKTTGMRGKSQYDVAACFENKNLMTRKKVSFHFMHALAASALGYEGESMGDPLEGNVEELGKLVTELQGEQRNLKRSQQAHRATVESTNTMMYLWVISQVVILILSALGQIFFLNRFLAKKARF